jgi:hypothetical protein
VLSFELLLFDFIELTGILDVIHQRTLSLSLKQFGDRFFLIGTKPSCDDNVPFDGLFEP